MCRFGDLNQKMNCKYIIDVLFVTGHDIVSLRAVTKHDVVNHHVLLSCGICH